MFFRERGRDPGGDLRAAMPVVAGSPCPLLRPFLTRAKKSGGSSGILILGEMCGANVTWLAERGFRVTFQGTPRIEDAAAGSPDLERLVAAARLTPAERGFAGALLWDTLSCFPPPRARQISGIMAEALAPGGALLAFFPPATTSAGSRRTRFRIIDEDRVGAEPVERESVSSRPWANREILKLFEPLELDLLHTHRDGQREVLFYKRR